jgi:hypothetical protein
MDVIFDYSELIGKIISKFKTRKAFAEKMNMDYGSLIHKLNGKYYWFSIDIYRACCLLDIDLNDIPKYFFTQKVEQE